MRPSLGTGARYQGVVLWTLLAVVQSGCGEPRPNDRNAPRASQRRTLPSAEAEPAQPKPNPRLAARDKADIELYHKRKRLEGLWRQSFDEECARRLDKWNYRSRFTDEALDELLAKVLEQPAIDIFDAYRLDDSISYGGVDWTLKRLAALRRVATRSYETPGAMQHALSYSMQRLVKHGSAGDRRFVAQHLGAGSEAGRRLAAVKALGTVGPEGRFALSRLKKLARLDSSPDVRLAAATVAGNLTCAKTRDFNPNCNTGNEVTAELLAGAPERECRNVGSKWGGTRRTGVASVETYFVGERWEVVVYDEKLRLLGKDRVRFDALPELESPPPTGVVKVKETRFELPREADQLVQLHDGTWLAGVAPLDAKPSGVFTFDGAAWLYLWPMEFYGFVEMGARLYLLESSWRMGNRALGSSVSEVRLEDDGPLLELMFADQRRIYGVWIFDQAFYAALGRDLLKVSDGSLDRLYCKEPDPSSYGGGDASKAMTYEFQRRGKALASCVEGIPRSIEFACPGDSVEAWKPTLTARMTVGVDKEIVAFEPEDVGPHNYDAFLCIEPIVRAWTFEDVEVAEPFDMYLDFMQVVGPG